MRFLLMIATLAVVFSSASAFRVTQAVLDKRITDLTFPMTHDAATHTPLNSSQLTDITLKGITAFAVDQDRTITQQLDDGIRSIRFNVEYLTTNDTLGQYEGIYCVHGKWAESFAAKLFLGLDLQTVFSPFEQELTVIRDWLNAHTDQIVFIFDEGSAGSNNLGPIYERVLSTANFKAFQAPAAGAEWPTYGELLSTNQRLIVFVQDGSVPNPLYPYLNHMYYSAASGIGSITQSPYSYYTPADIGFFPNQTGQHGYSGAGDWSAPLYLFNHFFYTDGFPIFEAKFGIEIEVIKLFTNEFDFSDPTKSNWTVGDQLVTDVRKAMSPEGANRKPNFINVDFYEGVGFQTQLFSLVDQLNNE